MTLTEILKAHGVEDAVISKITADMKSNKIFTSAEENIDLRYGKLKEEFDNLTAQHGESAKLIEQLKAGTKNSEEMQGKITAYESDIQKLQEQLAQTQLDAEIKVALLAAKATDIDYMTFKLKEKGELTLDENGKIKGIDDKLAGLKTQFPNQFEKAGAGMEVDSPPLPDGDDRKAEPKNLAQALQMQYEATHPNQ